MAYQKNRHNLGITNVGSAGSGTDLVGMMLAKRDDGSPAYEEYDGKFLADQFFTGAPSQVNIDPEVEFLLGGTDWRSGFGLQYADRNDPKRYFSSIGMDLSNRGMAIAGQTPTTITLPTHTISDWNAAVNHGDPGSEWSNEANAYDGNTGTYSAATLPGGTGWTSYIELYVAAISCDQIRFWFTEGVNNGVKAIDIDLWYDDQWNNLQDDSSIPLDGEGAFFTVAIGSTKTVTAARVRFQDNSGSGGDARLNELQFYAVSATIQGTVLTGTDFNDKLYAPFGNALIKQNAGGTAFTVVSAFPVDITDIEPFTDSRLYIALGTSEPYWYMSTAEVVTESTATNKTYKYFATVHTTASTMYGSDADNTIRNTTDPVNGGVAWSSTTTVGASYHAIQGLLEKGGALYIPKEDMIYYLDSSGNVQRDLAPRLQALTSSTSGKNALTDGQVIMYPAGAQGLLEIDTSTTTATLTWRNPSNFCTNLSDFVGRVQAVAFDEAWWFFIVDNSAKIEVIKGRKETIDGTTSFVQHPMAEITLTNCQSSWVSSIFQKRLWITSDTIGESLYYIPLPVGYGDIENDANRLFKTGTTFETGFLHGGFRNVNKSWLQLTLTMGHTYNAGRYFTVKYKKLGDSSWTSIGNFDGTSSSMLETQSVDTTNKPFSPMMNLQFTAVTDDTDYTPILLDYTLKAVMYPPIRRLIHCVIDVNDYITTKDGIESNRYSLIKTTLDNARNNPVWPVSIRDIDGSTLDVKFLPVPKSLQRLLVTKATKNRTQERIYHLLMMQVSGAS